MSKDLRLKHKCPHHVIEEWLAIEDDLQTLRTVRYPSSKQIKVLWNRTEVPRDGLASSIEVTGLKTEPFEIEIGDNDTLAFSVDGQATQTVTLPQGRKIKAANLARAINDQSTGITASVKNGRLTLEHNKGGSQSSLKMEGGNAHSTLGFAALRYYRGRIVVPGWEIIKDKDSVDPHARVIRFHESLRTDDDIFEVSYHTVRGVCRRCMGLGIENDLRHDRKGDPIFVENQRLLLQEVEKIVFTVKGSNLFHRWYGTSISELIGSKIVGGGQYVKAQLVTEISDALERYKQIKEQQSRYQPVSRKEMLQRIVSIEVKQDKFDATVFDVSIVLESQSGELEQITDTLLVGDANFAQGFQRVK